MKQKWHVLPIKDLKQHIESTDCWCMPVQNGDVIIHSSADGREYFEITEVKTKEDG